MPSKPANVPSRCRKPLLGCVSLGVFVLAPLLAGLVAAQGESGEFGVVGALATGVVWAGLVWLVGVVAAVLGLWQCERPRWPAVLGLALNLISASLILFLVLRSRASAPDSGGFARVAVSLLGGLSIQATG